MAEYSKSAERGFTLIEVLVSFAILAIALAFLMHVIANVVSRTGEADARVGALQVAQSLVDRVGIDRPLEDGIADGESGSLYRWQLKIEPYGDEEDRENWPVAAHEVTVTVSWGDHGDLMLSTLKLGSKDGAH